MNRTVVLVVYDPFWPEKFEKEAEKLGVVFGSNLVRMHHIGSTSIPGMMAKPIIDMLFVVQDITQVDRIDRAMSELGYEAMGEFGIPGRRYFRKLDGEVHLFHLHVFALGDPEVDRHVNFRDYLRAHPGDALAYQELKIELAEMFPQDPGSYTDGKTAFIQAVDARAKEWHAQRED